MTKQKLTITELLKNKEKYVVKDDVTEELHIKRIDSNIVIKKPDKSLFLDSAEIESNGKMNPDTFMVYHTVVEPNLKDPELQKQFGCIEPTDIVEKIFEMGEITHIALAVTELAGFGDSVKKAEAIKN